jgi:hypothetical protein
MYKIKKISFQEHPVLGNLVLNFCNLSGKAVDTIIFAGENGTGKSTILNELYKIASHTVDYPMVVDFENENCTQTFSITYYWKKLSNSSPLMFANDGHGMDTYIRSDEVKNRYQFNGIYSDVDINFHAQQVSSVTSLSLDEATKSRRSSTNIPTEINQLLIDIQALDDADVAFAVRKHPEVARKDLVIEERMPRFTVAFNRMFNGLTYSRVKNDAGHKSILFQKNGVDISINSLSSGEKQIVYRGCFLLKDVNAMNGAFAFIDEPEISLHPTWQMKIMDYYKSIFTDASGSQTSQIFAVTHSLFVIHNENRKNDKVIVLARDDKGTIIVKDKPEYYKCTSVEVIKDAFYIQGFSTDMPTVYLEGRTDEKYFKKAAEVFGYDIPFRFQWVGYMKDEKNEENTGKDSLNKAVQFLIARNLPIKNVCLFDCDTNRSETVKNNVYTCVIPVYVNSKRMKKGIENALIFDKVDLSPFYSTKTKEGDYGDDNTITEFNKMACCDHICSLDAETLKTIFTNLKTIMDKLISIFNAEQPAF